jgi:thiamine biosynthesis protein ThiS
MPDTVHASISILVNGDAHAVRQGETLSGLVAALNLQPERLAIELDRRIVKRAEWSSTLLSAGAKVEIVQFVGGG